jgi:hypothetical protein
LIKGAKCFMLSLKTFCRKLRLLINLIFPADTLSGLSFISVSAIPKNRMKPGKGGNNIAGFSSIRLFKGLKRDLKGIKLFLACVRSEISVARSMPFLFEICG